MLKIFKLVFVLFTVSIYTTALGQGQGNNPYSVLGIGEEAEETVAAQDMMGGTGVSFTNTFYVNQLNPAMLVKNRTVNSVKYVAFSIGFKGKYNNIQQGNNLQQDFGLNLNNLTLAFPLTPKWATSISFKPYTIAQYTHTAESTFQNSNIRNKYTYKTDGGVSRVTWTNSFQVAKGLFLGIEGQYNFGTVINDTTFNIPNTYEIYRNSVNTSWRGVSAKGGLTYQMKLNKKWNLNAGGTYQFGSDLTGKELKTFNVLAENQNGAVFIKSPDTLSLNTIKTGIPSKYRLGLSLESSFHWVFAAEYALTNWNNVTQYDNIANRVFVDSKELNLGVEWLPNSSSPKYFNQVFYRAGFKSTNTPYMIGSTQIKDQSFSLGFSLPMGITNRNPSYFDLSVSLGKRGLTTNGNIQENYTKISANFSLLSNWFAKQRIE